MKQRKSFWRDDGRSGCPEGRNSSASQPLAIASSRSFNERVSWTVHKGNQQALQGRVRVLGAMGNNEPRLPVCELYSYPGLSLHHPSSLGMTADISDGTGTRQSERQGTMRTIGSQVFRWKKKLRMRKRSVNYLLCESGQRNGLRSAKISRESTESVLGCIFALIAVLATFIRSRHHRVGAPPASSTRWHADRCFFGIQVCFRQFHIDRIAL